MGVHYVDAFLNKSFYRLGRTVGENPGYFLIVPILLTMFCITGIQQFHYNIDPEYLFSPRNGPGKVERATVEQYFKMNYTDKFDVSRITRAGRFGRVIVTANDGDKNILREAVFKELRLLDEIVQNITVFYEDEYFTYKEICAKWLDKCFENTILNLDQIIDQVERKELNLTFPIMFNPVTWDAHAFPVFFGGSQVDEDGLIVSVPSVQLVYFMNVDTKKLEAKGSAWEDAFLDKVGEEQDAGRFKHIRIARFSSRTLDHELEKNTRTVIPYFLSTFVIMAAFSVLTCMMTDWVRSKPWLGLLGNISAGMATVSAFGTCMYLGVDFIGLNFALPFLMIGIGIDDTFVMLAAWRRTSIKDSVPERMGKMLSEAAVSITITSVTDLISFLIGIFNQFPSVQIFCIYSSMATVYLFIWHLTFFTSCLAISGYCEQKNLHSVICVRVESVSRSRHRSWLYRMFCTGGVDPEDMDNPMDNPEHGVMVFFRDYFAKFLNNSCVKTIVILTFGFYLVGAIYGVQRIEEGLERRKVARSDSYAIEFFDREDDYFREFPYRIQVIVSGELDYSDPVVQRQIENLTQTFENSSYCSNALYTESWLRSFLQYASRNEDYLNISLSNSKDFIKTLKDIWLYPTSPFSLDVKFNEAGDRIIGMRFLIQAVNISGTEHEKEMVRYIRKLCIESPLNVSVFHPYFVFFDQFELVKPMSIQNMIVGAIIMMIVTFLFIPNVLCSIWVAFSIISIETGVIGYMALWHVNLDSISMINLIMCIGFSVDFTAHICYAYMSSTKNKPSERVEECLYALGLPVFQGACSTILGMIGLLLANSYIFSVFFKMIFLVVFCGAMHGLFLLPVLLSLFGPGSCKKQKEEEIKLSTIEKTFPHPYCIPHPQFTLNGAHLASNLTLKGPKLLTNGKSSEQVNKGFIDVEKDLGLGTSEENSSESSSNKSNKKNEEEPPRAYAENWRKRSLGSSPNQFQAQRTLDLFGADAEMEWKRVKEAEQHKRRFSDNYQGYNNAHQRQRRHSPSDQKYYQPPLTRSTSYHHIKHPKYVKEMAFP